MALPSLRQLTYFVTLAETLHFTEAAQQCFVTQSTLSGGIQELEKILGGILFERSRHAISLTDFGQQVLPRAQRLLAEAKELVQLASELSEPLTGPLRIAIIPTIAPFIINRLVDAVADKWPRLQLQLFELQSAQAVAQLTRGDADFVLLALPYEVEDFFITHICDDVLKLVVHRQFTGDSVLASWREGQAAIDLDQLTLDRLLLLEEGHCLREHTLTACPVGTTASQGGFETSSLLTLVQLIQARVGYGFLPAMALNGGLLASSNDLVQVPLVHEPVREIALLSRRTSPRRVEHAALTQLLQQLLTQPVIYSSS